MSPSREDIIGEFLTALTEADAAEARLYSAEALDQVTSFPGLRYASMSADRSSYVVGCDGQAIGWLWPSAEKYVFGGWTAAPFGTSDRLGPFRTARAAAAGLAEACKVSPRHTDMASTNWVGPDASADVDAGKRGERG